ncbi:TGF-beta-activated kinase 1 and MAP3K7-binding protein 1-like [Ciona intestinalis]
MNMADTSIPSPSRRTLSSGVSWTDDLPLCQLSDVGMASNVAYLTDGRQTEAFPYEDRAFNFATDYDCYLYGVFDGYDGSRAAHFAAERLPAELLLGQLTSFVNEKSTKNILQQAISIVERGFFESIDIELAKITHLQSQLPERLTPESAERHYSSIVQQIKLLNDSIRGGTTAVVALVVNNNLYIANVGDSRALLCQRDPSGVVKVQQITVNHDINNEDELERLSKLGLNVEKILERGRLGMNECTRCIGDYWVKGGYKKNPDLKGATSEPIIATPDIYGGLPLTEIEGGFLVLMSDDVYKSLEQSTGHENANIDIANMVSHEMLCRNTMQGVAQNVIDKISFTHSKAFGRAHSLSRGDITLVVRNISHPLGIDALPDINPILPDLSGRHPVSVPYKRNSRELIPTTGDYPAGIPTLSLVMPPQSGSENDPIDLTPAGTSPPSEDTPTNLVVGDATFPPTPPENLYYRSNAHEPAKLDSQNRVAPYVSFDTFDNEAWNKMQEAKKALVS